MHRLWSGLLRCGELARRMSKMTHTVLATPRRPDRRVRPAGPNATPRARVCNFPSYGQPPDVPVPAGGVRLAAVRWAPRGIPVGDRDPSLVGSAAWSGAVHKGEICNSQDRGVAGWPEAMRPGAELPARERWPARVSQHPGERWPARGDEAARPGCRGTRASAGRCGCRGSPLPRRLLALRDNRSFSRGDGRDVRAV